MFIVHIGVLSLCQNSWPTKIVIIFFFLIDFCDFDQLLMPGNANASIALRSLRRSIISISPYSIWIITCCTAFSLFIIPY